jgi:MFS family permease
MQIREVTAAGAPKTRGWRDRGAYLVMISPNVAVGLTAAAMPAILPELALRVGGRGNAEWIASIASFGIISGGLFSGRLPGRFGIRRVILGALLLFAVSAFSGMVLVHPIALAGSRFVLGMAAVCFSTAALALTTASFTGMARSKVFGQQQAFSQIANVCAVFIVGALAELLGWRGAFALLGAYALALFAIAVICVRGAASEVAAEDRSAASAEQLGRGFWIAGIVAIEMGILGFIPMIQLPFLIANDSPGSAARVSLATGGFFVVAAVSAMYYGRMKAWLGGRRVFLAGIISTASGIALMGISHAFGVVFAGAMTAGLGVGFCNPYVFDYGVGIVPQSKQGQAAGLLFSLLFLGAAINPLAVAPFEWLFGQHTAMLPIAIVGAACGILVTVIQRAREGIG